MAPRRRARWTARMIDPRPLPGSGRGWPGPAHGASGRRRTARRVQRLRPRRRDDPGRRASPSGRSSCSRSLLPGSGPRTTSSSSRTPRPAAWSRACASSRRRGPTRACRHRSANPSSSAPIPTTGGAGWSGRSSRSSTPAALSSASSGRSSAASRGTTGSSGTPTRWTCRPFPIWRWGRTLPEPPAGFTPAPGGRGRHPVPGPARRSRGDAAMAVLPARRRRHDVRGDPPPRRAAHWPDPGARAVAAGAPDGAAEPIGCVVHSSRVRQAASISGSSSWSPAGTGWSRPPPCWPTSRRGAPDHPDGPATGITLLMPDGHPARRCVSTRLDQPVGSPYGLYVRVPDLAEFLRAVAPGARGARGSHRRRSASAVS